MSPSPTRSRVRRLFDLVATALIIVGAVVFTVVFVIWLYGQWLLQILQIIAPWLFAVT